jgi:hypothetical protein
VFIDDALVSVIQARGIAQEPVRRGGALCAESVESAYSFCGRWRVEIYNGATERANRDIALGRGNGPFFGSDNEASSPLASGAASSRLPGSMTCSRAFRCTPSPD